MGFVKKMLGLEPTATKLLTADIVVNGGNQFFVELEAYDPELKSPELVRLVLHYYAEILFTLSDEDPGVAAMATELTSLTSKALTSPLEVECDVLAAAGLSDSVTLLDKQPVSRDDWAFAALFMTDDLRVVSADFSDELTIEQMVLSVLVLIQAVVDELGNNEFLLSVLEVCLREFNDSCVEDGSCLTSEKSVSLPNFMYATAFEALDEIWAVTEPS